MVTQLRMAESLARLQGIKINEREMVDNWILITYDLPGTEEGNKARGKFLKEAPKFGAVMHSRSVYLMPLTDEAQIAAVNLSKVKAGTVYVWTSRVDPEQAQTLTKFYDDKLAVQVEAIRDRIKKIEKHELDNKFGLADRIRRKTVKLFNQLLFAVAQRGSAEVFNDLLNLEKQLLTPEK